MHPAAYPALATEAFALAPTTDRIEVARQMVAGLEKELATVRDKVRRARLAHEAGRLLLHPIADYDRALAKLQEARTLRPGHLPTLRALSLLRLVRGEWEALHKALGDELEVVDEPTPRARLLEARAHLLEFHFERSADARGAYAEALALVPGDVALQRALLRIDRKAASKELPRTLERLSGLTAKGEDPGLAAARITERARVLEKTAPLEATALYEQALEVEAISTGAALSLVRLYASPERRQELTRVLVRLAELLDDPVERATLLFVAGEMRAERPAELESARSLFEQASALLPRDQRPLRALERLEARAGNHARRALYLERLAALEEDPARRVDCMIRIAETLRLYQGDLPRAILWYEEACRLDPASDAITVPLIELYRHAGDTAQLVRVLEARERAIGDLAERAQLSAELARLEEGRGDFTRAMAHLRAALSLEPHNPVLLRQLERLLGRLGRHAELAELSVRLGEAAVDPSEAVHYFLQASSIFESALGDLEVALGHAKVALERDPKHVPTLAVLTRLATLSAKPELALETMEREAALTKLAPRRVALLLGAATTAYEQLGDEQRALSLAKQVLSIEPRSRAALTLQKRIFQRTGRIRELAHALEVELGALLEPAEKIASHLTLGRLYQEQLKEGALALEHYKKAAELDGAHGRAAEELAHALGQLGRLDDLAQHLKEKSERASNAEDKRELLLELARLHESRQHRPKDARAAYEATLAVDADSVEAREGRIRTLAAVGDKAELARALEASAKSTRDASRRRLALLAAAELMEGDLGAPERAVLLLEQVRSEVPTHQGALGMLERLYDGLGKRQELVSVLRSEIEVVQAPAERVGLLRQLAAVTRDGDRSGHAAALLELRTWQPTDLRALSEIEEVALATKDGALLADVDRALAEQQVGPLGALHRVRLAESMEAHNPELALALVERALVLDPESIGAVRSLARIAEAGPNVELVERGAELALSVCQDQVEASRLYLVASARHEAEGDRERAVSTVRRALDANPDDGRAAQRLTSLLEGDGRVDELIAALSEAALAAKRPEMRVGHWIVAARLLADVRGDLGAAIAALLRVADAEGGQVRAQLELAELYIRDRQYKAAAARLEKATSADKVAVDADDLKLARVRLASLYADHLARPADAASLLRVVLRDHPSDSAALRRLLAIELTNREPTARATAEAWARSSTGSERAEALTTLGRLARDAGDVEGAVGPLLEAVGLEGVVPSGAHRDLMRLFESGKAAPGGRADYVAALERFVGGSAPPEERARAASEAGRVLLDFLGDRERGFRFLALAAELTPRSAAHASTLASRCFDAALYDRALPEAYRAAELAPLEPAHWQLLASTFERLGKNAESHLALGPLIRLGGGTTLERSTWAARSQKPAHAREQAIDAQTVESMSRASLGEPLGQLLEQLAPLAGKVLGTGADALGLTSRERVGPRGNHPIRPIVDRVTRVFFDLSLDVYPSPGARRVELLLLDTPSVVLPGALFGLTESKQVFCVAWAAALFATHAEVLAARGASEFSLLLEAALRTAGRRGDSRREGDAAVDDASRRLAKALPWLAKGRFEEAVRRYAEAPAEGPAVVRAAEVYRACFRLALVLSDDLDCVSLLESSGAELFGLDPADVSPLVQDLITTWVSPRAMALRRTLGMLE